MLNIEFRDSDEVLNIILDIIKLVMFNKAIKFLAPCSEVNGLIIVLSVASLKHVVPYKEYLPI